MKWKYLVTRTGLEAATPGLVQVIHELRAFLMPLVAAAIDGEAFNLRWKDGVPWS